MPQTLKCYEDYQDSHSIIKKITAFSEDYMSMHHFNYGNFSLFLLYIVDKAIGGNYTVNFKVLMEPPVFSET